MKTLTIYHPVLTGKGGVTTFTHNFCKRMSKHYDITLVYQKANNDNLLKIGQYIKIKPLRTVLSADVVILATNNNNVHINSKNVIQMVHASLDEQKKYFGVEYIHNPSTTKIVCVGNHVKEVFERMYPYKVDAVIYNML